MPSVFSPCGGSVIKAPTCETRFLTIEVAGRRLFNHGLVTGVSVALSGNYQFLHTVNNFIYLYSFGDRISTINITGMGFIRTCGGGNAEKTQLQKVYAIYKDMRVAKRKTPLDIVITGDNSTNFKFIGYLTGMNIDLKNTDPLGTVGFWNMKFDAVIDS